MLNIELTGTKKRIFDVAVEQFAMRNYENVSLKDIADVIGIKKPSLYNHFTSKQEILDTCYDYYTKHFNDEQKPVDEMKALLETGTKEEFCNTLMFTFMSEDKEKWKTMTLLTKIIYLRFFQDEQARDIFLGIMNRDVENYVIEILQHGISKGILEEFDTETYAKFLVGQRHIMGIKAFADPNYVVQQLEEEKRIMKVSADMLPFSSKS